MTYKPTDPELSAQLSKELRVSRKMLQDGIEVVPRFVIAGPQGNQIVILTNLARAGPERQQALNFLGAFMTFHMCDRFVMAFQTVAPKTLTAILVSRSGFAAATQSVCEKPHTFGEIVIHDPRHTDVDILDILPGKQNHLSQAQLNSIRSFMVSNEIAPNTYTLEI